jgi:uncharacterized protein (TIGR02722 family)
VKQARYDAGALLRAEIVAAMCLLAAGLAAGCASKTSYGDATAQETLTIDFGSTDLQMIAAKMVDSLLSSPLVRDNPTPVVRVSRVRNKTDEHIDTKAITDKIRTALINSGKVRFVAGEVRDEIIDELEYQRGSGYVDEATRKRIGMLVGADYLLVGDFTSIRKKSGRTEDLYYLFTLNLVDIQTGLIAWSDQKEIRKAAKRPIFGL